MDLVKSTLWGRACLETLVVERWTLRNLCCEEGRFGNPGCWARMSNDMMMGDDGDSILHSVIPMWKDDLRMSWVRFVNLQQTARRREGKSTETSIIGYLNHMYFWFQHNITMASLNPYRHLYCNSLSCPLRASIDPDDESKLIDRFKSTKMNKCSKCQATYYCNKVYELKESSHKDICARISSGIAKSTHWCRQEPAWRMNHQLFRKAKLLKVPVK